MFFENVRFRCFPKIVFDNFWKSKNFEYFKGFHSFENLNFLIFFQKYVSRKKKRVMKEYITKVYSSNFQKM